MRNEPKPVKTAYSGLLSRGVRQPNKEKKEKVLKYFYSYGHDTVDWCIYVEKTWKYFLIQF